MMRKAIDSEAAWRASDIAREEQWLRRLTRNESEAAVDMLETVRDSKKPMLELTREDVPLGAFSSVLEEVRRELEHGIGFRTLRGLPVGRFGVEDNRLLFWSNRLPLGCGPTARQGEPAYLGCPSGGGAVQGRGRARL